MAVIGLEQASFLGNSFGCQQVIADLAARYPERVEAVLLLLLEHRAGRPPGD
jgi:2-hydroxy-6-oxonona-2,4-dienedioate hydrolase